MLLTNIDIVLPQVYSEPCQTTKMELLTKLVNDFQSLFLQKTPL